MNEERFRMKTGLLLITYAILLLAILFNLPGVLQFLGSVLAILSPFIYSIIIAYVLNILLRLFEKLYGFMDKSKSRTIHKLKRPLSILSVFLVLALLIYLLMGFAIPQLSASVGTLAANIPDYVNSFEEFLNKTVQDFGLSGGFFQSISLNWDDIIKKAGEFIKTTFPPIFAFTSNIADFNMNTATGVGIAIYLLFSKEKLLLTLRKLIYAFLPKRAAGKIIDAGVMANRIFSSYISGLIVNAAITGILAFIAMALFRIPYAFLLSMIIGVMALIPILGPILGFILGLIVLLFVNPSKALIYAIVIFLVQQIDSNLIYPRVVGCSIGLNGPLVLFALILGGSLFGFVGMIAGIPAFAVIYVLMGRITQRRLEKKEIRVD